jgi:molybdopterin synthase catalytic subunit
MIPYSEFVTKIRSIQIDYHDPRLFHFLGEISAEECAAGRGMLTALVVHKHGDMQPGPGFFELAQALGQDTSDIVKFWIEEVKRVFAAWKG